MVDVPDTGAGSLPSIWGRLAAKVFDYLIVMVPVMAMSLPYFTDSRFDPDDPTAILPAWLKITYVVAPLLLDFVFTAWRGATPGKMLFGMKVVRFADGGKVAPYQAGLRTLVPGLGEVVGLAVPTGGASGLLGLVQPLMWMSSVYHPMRRGIHDLAAGTIVVRTE